MSIFNQTGNQKIFFTSDTHFGSERTLELSKRPFISVEKMDEVLIRNWNSVVDSHSIVYHLGDFGDIETAKSLNGEIFLIPGNYEYDNENNIFSIYKGGNKFDVNKYEFIEALNKNFINPLFPDDDNLLMPVKLMNNIYGSHIPSYHKYIPDNKDYFYLFGHIHKLQMVKRYGLNVGTDCHNFTPISYEDVLFYKNGIEKYYDNEVFDY